MTTPHLWMWIALELCPHTYISSLPPLQNDKIDSSKTTAQDTSAASEIPARATASPALDPVEVEEAVDVAAFEPVAELPLPVALAVLPLPLPADVFAFIVAWARGSLVTVLVAALIKLCMSAELL